MRNIILGITGGTLVGIAIFAGVVKIQNSFSANAIANAGKRTAQDPYRDVEMLPVTFTDKDKKSDLFRDFLTKSAETDKETESVISSMATPDLENAVTTADSDVGSGNQDQNDSKFSGWAAPESDSGEGQKNHNSSNKVTASNAAKDAHSNTYQGNSGNHSNYSNPAASGSSGPPNLAGNKILDNKGEDKLPDVTKPHLPGDPTTKDDPPPHEPEDNPDPPSIDPPLPKDHHVPEPASILIWALFAAMASAFGWRRYRSGITKL